LAWAIGIPWSECEIVGGLLGMRTVTNEAVAYQELGRLVQQGGAISDKAALVTTVAMCSFANVSSIGIQVGGIGALVPERRQDLARLGLKALVISTLATSLSAAIAGVLA
jgi:CNT family concentrative nucleoside transporter